jgi:hypothetical protein
MLGSKTRAAREIKDGYMTAPPVYRMHIRPGRVSRQHQMLLDLEATGELVFYVAPRFSSEIEFNNAYLARTILEMSIFVTPLEIGSLNEEAHHLAFDDSGSKFVLYSDPRQLAHGSRSGESLMERTRSKQRRLTHEALEETARALQCVAESWQPQSLRFGADVRFAARAPEQRIGFLSRVVFGVEPVLIIDKFRQQG